jgi:hypothetical protein
MKIRETPQVLTSPALVLSAGGLTNDWVWISSMERYSFQDDRWELLSSQSVTLVAFLPSSAESLIVSELNEPRIYELDQNGSTELEDLVIEVSDSKFFIPVSDEFLDCRP